METKNSPTRSVERALDILECFINEDELTLLEISEKTNLSPSTVHRLASALQMKHFIERDSETKKFFLGSKINQLTNRSPEQSYDYLKKVAYNELISLNEKYNENVRIFIQKDKDKLCIDAIESTRSLRQIIKVGEKHEIYKGAAGKTLIAYMSNEQREEILETNNIDAGALEKIKENGYALSVGEREEGLVGIAAPIKDQSGKVIASLSLSGPTIRFINDEMNDKIKDTIQTANNISEKLGYIDI